MKFITAPGEPCERQRYPAARTMNAAIGKRYVGLDAKGNPTSGLILHVAHYAKSIYQQPLDYLIVTDPNGSGRPGHALVPAALIHEHVEGLALCAIMERDNE